MNRNQIVAWLRKPLEDWNKFWFEECSTLNVGVYRCLFGIVLILDLCTLVPNITLFFTDAGYTTAATAAAAFINDGPRFSILYSIHSVAKVKLFFVIYGIMLVFFTLGLGTRIVKFVVFLMLISIHNRNAMAISCMDIFSGVMSFLFLWTSCDRSFSLDAFLWKIYRHSRNKPESRPPRAPAWSQRLMQLQLNTIYLFAFMAKIQGEFWRNGTAIYYVQHLAEFHQFPLPGLASSRLLVNLATYMTLFTQLFMATLVWIPALKPRILLFAFCDHAAAAWNLNLAIFQLLPMTTLVLFVNPETLERCLKTLRGLVSFQARQKVYWMIHRTGLWMALSTARTKKPAFSHRLKKAVISGCIICHFMAVFSWNFPLSYLGGTIWSWTRPYAVFLDQWQMWSMFANDNIALNMYNQAMIHFKDGTVVQHEFPRVSKINVWKRWIRHRESEMNYLYTDNFFKPYRPDMARYLARRYWTHLANPPLYVDFYAFWARVPPFNESIGKPVVLDYKSYFVDRVQISEKDLKKEGERPGNLI